MNASFYFGRSRGGYVKQASRLPLFVVSLLLTVAGRAAALEPPRVIPLSDHIKQPVSGVFQTLTRYFTDPSLSRFNLVSADKATGTIVAKQAGIDSDRWRQWAACKTDPLHMVYQFTDGTVAVTVKLERDARDTTFATVTADFQGVYGLAQDRTTIPCVSTGALEQGILGVAGASASNR